MIDLMIAEAIKTSKATATRDLQELKGMGALAKEGGGHGTRYYLNLER